MPFAFLVLVGDVGNVFVRAQVWQRDRPRLLSAAELELPVTLPH